MKSCPDAYDSECENSDLQKREDRGGAYDPGKEFVEHEQRDLAASLSDVVLDDDLQAERHVHEGCDDEKRHQHGVDGFGQKLDGRDPARADQRKNGDDEPDGQRDEGDSSDPLAAMKCSGAAMGGAEALDAGERRTHAHENAPLTTKA